MNFSLIIPLSHSLCISPLHITSAHFLSFLSFSLLYTSIALTYNVYNPISHLSAHKDLLWFFPEDPVDVPLCKATLSSFPSRDALSPFQQHGNSRPHAHDILVLPGNVQHAYFLLTSYPMPLADVTSVFVASVLVKGSHHEESNLVRKNKEFNVLWKQILTSDRRTSQTDPMLKQKQSSKSFSMASERNPKHNLHLHINNQLLSR